MAFVHMRYLDWGGQETAGVDIFRVEAEDVDTRGFLASPVQVTHVYKGHIAIDGDAFDLAGYAPGLLDVAHDGIEPIREKGVVCGYMARSRDRDKGPLWPSSLTA